MCVLRHVEVVHGDGMCARLCAGVRVRVRAHVCVKTQHHSFVVHNMGRFSPSQSRHHTRQSSAFARRLLFRSRVLLNCLQASVVGLSPPIHTDPVVKMFYFVFQHEQIRTDHNIFDHKGGRVMV